MNEYLHTCLCLHDNQRLLKLLITFLQNHLTLFDIYKFFRKVLKIILRHYSILTQKYKKMIKKISIVILMDKLVGSIISCVKRNTQYANDNTICIVYYYYYTHDIILYM